MTAVGLNPINNIVDLTNFIMAELAQPMHAFDRAKLAGDTIWRAGTRRRTVVALNDEEYALDAGESGDCRRSGTGRDRRRDRRTGQRDFGFDDLDCAGEREF